MLTMFLVLCILKPFIILIDYLKPISFALNAVFNVGTVASSGSPVLIFL